MHREGATRCDATAHTPEDNPMTTPPVSRKTLLSAAIAPAKAVATVEIQEVTMAPGQPAPLHLHPCPTLGVVTRGSIAFQIEGQPVQHLKAGDAFYEPADVRVARFDNDGDAPATFVVHYLLGPDEHETVRVLPHAQA